MAQNITVTDKSTHQATTVTGLEAAVSARSIVQLSLPHSQIKTLARHGGDLLITTADGKTIVVHGFFADGPGHSDLVVQDSGGLWFIDLSDMGSLPMDTSVDTASSNVFSSIESIDPLYSNAPNSLSSLASADAAATFGDDMGGSANPFGLEMLPVAVALGGVGISRISSGSDSSSGFSPGPNVSQNANGTMTVSGKVQPGDIVTINFADGTSNSGTADANGYYAVTSKGVQTSGIVTVIDTDANGNSTSSAQYWSDHTAPQAPGVGAVTANADGTFTLTGTAEPGSAITVTFEDGKTATGKADADGKYTVQISGNETGKTTVTATDSSGNHSAGTDVALPTQSTTTNSDDGTMTVSGTAEPGSAITVTFADGKTATGVAGPDGKYTVTSDSPESGSVKVEVVNPAPSAPTVDSITANADGTVTVTGTATAGSTVILTFTDGSQTTGKADAQGNYSVKSNLPETMGGAVHVTVTDTLGNTSGATSTSPITQSTQGGSGGLLTVSGTAAPGSTITVTFADKTTATGTAGADGHYSVTSKTPETSVTSVTATNLIPEPPTIADITNNPDGTVTVTGVAHPGSTVTVTYADGSTAQGKAGADGSFSIDSGTSGVAHGPVSATSSFPATGSVLGNTSVATPVTSITQDSEVDSSSGKMTVSGTAAPGSAITVTFADGHTATTTADSSGKYSVQSDDPESGTFTVTAVNPPPQAPTITGVQTDGDGAVWVWGTTVPYSTVTVTYADKTTQTIKAGSNGSYSIHSDKAESGSVSLTVTDALGHVSGSINAVFPTTETTVTNSDGTMTVSGTAAPYSYIVLTFADGTNAADYAKSDGSYSISSKYPESGPVSVSMITTIAPLITPVIKTMTSNPDGTLTVDGTATANTTVTVHFPDGSTKTGTVDGNGHYSVQSDHAQTESGNITVSGADWSGNHSPDASSPWAPAPGNSTDTSSHGMAITDVQHNDDGALAVSGTSAPDSTVTVTFPDSSTATATADASGNWGNATSSAAQPSGQIDAMATDASGNSISATPYEYTATSAAAGDTAAITAITAITPDTGVGGDFITAEGSLTVSGTHGALPTGETVQVNLGDGKGWHAATLDTDGAHWSFNNTANPLPDGLYMIQSHVTDASGKVVGPTLVQEVEVSASGTLTLSLTDVLSDASVLTSAGSTQKVTVNDGGGIVTTVHLTDGVGAGASQWQDTGTTTINGVTYDVYHNAAQGSSTVADLLIQHGITVTGI